MKKQLFFAIAALAVSMSFVSCSEKLVSGDVKFNAKAPQGASWTGKEVIAISVDGASPVTVNASEGSSSDVTAALSNCPASADIYAAVPYVTEGAGVNSLTKDALTITIPESQKSRDDACDATAQLMFSKASYSGGLPSSLELPFKSILATGKLVISNAPEAIKSVKLKFAKNVVGGYSYSIVDGTFTEGTASAEISLKGGAGNAMYFACAPVDADVIVEITGEGTGIVYSKTVKASLAAGKSTELKVDLSGALKLYIVGSAVGKEAAADAIALTDNGDGSFSWTGRMAGESEFKLIFDKENLTPALGIGDAYNKIKYSTKATAAPFEVAKAGNYKVTVWPAYSHIQVKRIFDHVLADHENACPLCSEFDDAAITPEVPNTWTSLIGPFLHNHYYNVFDIDNTFKLSGPNSFHVEIFGTAPDWGQGHIFRSGDYKQPYAVEGKTYTVMMQMMYTGDKDEQKIKIGFEGALGTGSRTNEVVTLTKDEPFQYIKEYTADNTWGGCVNLFISFDLVDVVADVDSPMQFYLDAINIGYDD